MLRFYILDMLSQPTIRVAPFSVLKDALKDILGNGVTGDRIITEVHWLYEQGYLIAYEREVWCAEITSRGTEVVSGHFIAPGIQPSPKIRKAQ